MGGSRGTVKYTVEVQQMHSAFARLLAAVGLKKEQR